MSTPKLHLTSPLFPPGGEGEITDDMGANMEARVWFFSSFSARLWVLASEGISYAHTRTYRVEISTVGYVK